MKTTEHTHEKYPTRQEVNGRAPPAQQCVRMLTMCVDTPFQTRSNQLSFWPSRLMGWIQRQAVATVHATHTRWVSRAGTWARREINALLHNTEAAKTHETGYKTARMETRPPAQGKQRRDKQGRHFRSGLAFPQTHRACAQAPGFPSVGHSHRSVLLNFLS